MFHVREHLSELPEHMELDRLYDWLRQEDQRQYLLVEEGGLDVEEMYSDPLRRFNVKVKRMIKEFLTHADDDIMKTIDDLVRRICHSVSNRSKSCNVPNLGCFVLSLFRRCLTYKL